MKRAGLWLLVATRLAQAEPSTYTLEPARLTDGAHIALPPMSVTPTSAPSPDRRPLFIGGGLLVMAVGLWWNRRPREQFDRDDRDDRGPRGPAPAAGPRTSDDDGDDLHAAARGESSKDET